MVNAYSQTWFETFLHAIPGAVTEGEIAFLDCVLPRPEYSRILDLCCGAGRHAIPLVRRGYRVTGVDRDRAALQRAQDALRGTDACLVECDMRDLADLPGPFDAAIVMWQSFGYFDAVTNRDVLSQLAQLLRPGGKLVLDIYHRAFFEAHPGTRTLESNGRTVQETKWMEGDRLHVRLEYGSGATDAMEWQLFYPEETIALAEGVGFRTEFLCSEWNESLPPSPAIPRMQVVLGKL